MNSEITGIIAASCVLLVNQVFHYVKRRVWDDPISVQLKKLNSDISAIKYQVQPNGGKSLADQITAIRKDFAEFQRLAEKRWIISLDNTKTPVYLCDKSGHCIYVNKALAELFRMERAQMLVDGWAKRLKNPDLHFGTWIQCVKQELPYKAQYTLVDDKNKPFRTVLATAEAVRDENGEVLFYYCTCTDTTDTIKDTFS